MTLDTGTRIMAARRKRRLAVLVVLATITAAVLVLRQFQETPRPAHAAIDTKSQPATAAKGRLKPVPTTWPIELRRDVFVGWEPAVPLETVIVSGPRDESIRREAASRLRIDAIVVGNPTRVMINGQLLTVGQVVEEFRILRIEPNRVILEKHGVGVELTI